MAVNLNVDLRVMVDNFRAEAARLESKTVGRSINTESQAREIEYGLRKKAEGYRLCANSLENALNWYGVPELKQALVPAETNE